MTAQIKFNIIVYYILTNIEEIKQLCTNNMMIETYRTGCKSYYL